MQISFSGIAQNISFLELSGGAECAAYSWYRNPAYVDSYMKTSGSFAYNPGMWLGFTLGTKSIGIAAHGKAVVNIFNFDVQQCKGMSAYNYGLFGSVYILHPHAYDKFSLMISAGYQWNRTELWIKPRAFRSLDRDVFQTTNFQITVRMPNFGYESFFIRIGQGVDQALTVEAGLIVLGNLWEHYKN